MIRCEHDTVSGVERGLQPFRVAQLIAYDSFALPEPPAVKVETLYEAWPPSPSVRRNKLVAFFMDDILHACSNSRIENASQAEPSWRKSQGVTFLIIDTIATEIFWQ